MNFSSYNREYCVILAAGEFAFGTDKLYHYKGANYSKNFFIGILQSKQILVCNYYFTIDLAPNDSLYGAKSFGKV